MAIVKASGYGSDAVKIAKCLEKNNVDYLAVAYLFEAIQLRDNGLLSPILVLHPQIGDFNKIIEYNLEPNIYSFKILDEFLKYRVQNLNHPITCNKTAAATTRIQMIGIVKYEAW